MDTFSQTVMINTMKTNKSCNTIIIYTLHALQFT